MIPGWDRASSQWRTGVAQRRREAETGAGPDRRPGGSRGRGQPGESRIWMTPRNYMIKRDLLTHDSAANKVNARWGPGIFPLRNFSRFRYDLHRSQTQNMASAPLLSASPAEADGNDNLPVNIEKTETPTYREQDAAADKQVYRSLARSYVGELQRQKSQRKRTVTIAAAICTFSAVIFFLALVYL